MPSRSIVGRQPLSAARREAGRTSNHRASPGSPSPPRSPRGRPHPAGRPPTRTSSAPGPQPPPATPPPPRRPTDSQRAVITTPMWRRGIPWWGGRRAVSRTPVRSTGAGPSNFQQLDSVGRQGPRRGWSPISPRPTCGSRSPCSRIRAATTPPSPAWCVKGQQRVVARHIRVASGGGVTSRREVGAIWTLVGIVIEAPG